MLFAIKREELLSALKDVICASKKSTDYPALGGVLLQSDMTSGQVLFSCTDSNTFLQKRVHAVGMKEAGELLLNAELLRKCAELSEDTIVIAGDGTKGTIISGKARIELQALERKSFPMPQITFPDKTVRVTGLKSLIRRSVFAAAKNKSENVMLECVRFCFDSGKGTAAAMDTAACAFAVSPQCADGELNVVLHQDPLSILSAVSDNNDSYFVGIDKGMIVFMNDDTLFVTHLQNGEFANVDTLLSSFQAEYRALADAKDVYHAIDRCMVSVQDNTDYSVNVVFAQDGIHISISTCYGTVKDKVPVSEVSLTPKDGFHYNPDKLRAFLRNASGPLELLIDRQGCILMKANNSVYFVGPRRAAKLRQKKTTSGQNKSSKKNTADEQMIIAA